MKAKMLNQVVQRGRDKSSKWEKRRNLDKNLWSTAYITDIPIQTLTDIAEQKIEDFIDLCFKIDDELIDLTLERNGMLGFWQFTIITTCEIIDFEIEDK